MLTDTQKKQIRDDFNTGFPIGSMTDMQRAYMRDISDWFIARMEDELRQENGRFVELLRGIRIERSFPQEMSMIQAGAYTVSELVNERVDKALAIINNKE